ncbi:MAG: glycosyl transferase family 1 [Desulfovibrio sp.]|nr:glycosyl transferase family 1 [Desulfovibrio sp.]
MPVYLAVSLDVEEEGLFGGNYQTQGYTVTNTQSLPSLAPLFCLGIRPTLFCAYSVITDPRSVAILTHLRDTYGAELAAHLHHWNTPPIAPNLPPIVHRVPASSLSDTLFSEKLSHLLEAGEHAFGAPMTSFRMGRWDIHKHHFPLLRRLGITCDASVRPLHGTCERSANPDHFDAPSTPYVIPTAEGDLFEVPLTVTPILASLPRLLQNKGLSPTLTRCMNWLKSTTNYWGALALLPAYHPLWAMELVTKLYLARGGKLLSLTWHSSEIHPGGAPHIPDQAHADKLLHKVTSYISWLKQHYDICCLPMAELRQRLKAQSPTLVAETGDWTVAHPSHD